MGRNPNTGEIVPEVKIGTFAAGAGNIFGDGNAFNHTQFSGLDTTSRWDAQGNQVNGRFG